MTDSFRQAIIGHGLTPPDYIEAGRFMRFPGDGKHHGNKAGWCKLFDDQQYGIYGDHSTGLSKTWRVSNCKTYTPEEKKAFALERAKAERERDQSKREAQAEAAIGANKKWESCTPEMGMHKYLMAKNVQPYKLRNDGFKVVIPMYDQDRNICSVQTIDPNGEKRFFSGGRTDGAYFPIGKPNGVLCVAEGYSTAATIHEATGHAVAVAFSCENLQPVAEMLSRKFSNTKFIICADDDHEKEINVGMENAARAAASCDGVVAIPDFKDSKAGNTDFNDMERLFGMEAVKSVINDAKDKPEEDFMSHFEVTVEEAEQYDDPEFAYENLIIKGHMSVIVAAPNAGKTTIFMNEVCPKLVQAGYKVVYINADVGQADSKSMVTHAKDNGYRLLLPDMKAGLSMNHFVDQLMEFNEQGKSFPNHVFIFDTLKKMTDVIVKQRAKELYKLLRSMTAKGATIVTLGHTNKFNDANGEPIYEGTGDLRSDFDELIYLESPQKL